MTYTVRYNVWISMSDEEYNSAAFIESSFEDSYED